MSKTWLFNEQQLANALRHWMRHDCHSEREVEAVRQFLDSATSLAEGLVIVPRPGEAQPEKALRAER